MASVIRESRAPEKRYPTMGAFWMKDLSEDLGDLFDAQLIPVEEIARVYTQLDDIRTEPFTRTHVKTHAPALKKLAERMKTVQKDMRNESHLPYSDRKYSMNAVEAVNKFLGHYGDQLVQFKFLTPTQQANRVAKLRGAHYQI
jgi:hypothetical protein